MDNPSGIAHEVVYTTSPFDQQIHRFYFYDFLFFKSIKTKKEGVADAPTGVVTKLRNQW